MRHVKLIASVLAAMSLSFVLGGTTSSAAESAASRDKKEGRLMESTATMPEVTREYLLANGFKQPQQRPECLCLGGRALGDVARKLGFAITSLRPVPSSPPDQDVRHVFLGDAHCVVKSQPVIDPNHRLIRRKLNNPDVVCDVTVSFGKPAASHLRTDGSPHMKIKSVTVPQDRTKPIQATVELTTDGKKPLGIDPMRVHICLFDGEDRVFYGEALVPETARCATLVDPGKAVSLAVSSSTNSGDGKLWSDLAPGKYSCALLSAPRKEMNQSSIMSGLVSTILTKRLRTSIRLPSSPSRKSKPKQAGPLHGNRTISLKGMKRMRRQDVVALLLGSAVLLLSLIVADTAGSGAESAASRDKKEGHMESATAMPKLTRENLLAHGFKQSEKTKDSFVAEHVRLGDVESALGFQITALRPTVSQDMHSDTRHGLVEGKQVLIKSEVRDEKGQIVRKSLDKPDATCTVYVWVKKYVPPKPPLRSDSTPRVQVKSVTVPKDRPNHSR